MADFFKKSFLSLVLGICLLAFGLSKAYAGGFQLFEEGVSVLGNAFAGTAASVEDASTSFYNPAGMTLLPVPELLAAATLIDLDIKTSVKSATANSLAGLRVGLPPVPVLGDPFPKPGTV